MIGSRYALAAIIAALSLVSSGSVAAYAAANSPSSVDGADAVRRLAGEAAELLTDEVDLIARANPRSGISAAESAIVRAQLRSVDGQGQAVLVQLQGLGVQLTPAIESVLTRLPSVDDAAGDAGGPLSPLPVVYAAAIDDLTRILASPSAVAPVGDGSDGLSFALLVVAAISLLLFGGAALTNTLWRRPDRADLEASAWNDGLTGLPNRRRLDRDLTSHVCASAPTCVIMIHVDHFSAVNQEFGPEVGDDILHRLGTLVAHHVRADDVVYRYDNEEFCVLLPGADPAETRVAADRLVQTAHSVNLPNGANITVSIGAALRSGAGVTDAVALADRALHRAKRQGRDRAVFADDELLAR